mgnify:CR=1 FL=1
MLAKYISLVEWRIDRLLVGEYYCPTVSALVESGLEKVVGRGPPATGGRRTAHRGGRPPPDERQSPR